MSRPKPTILMSHVVSSTGKEEQVLAASAIYAVFHNGKPINLKTVSDNILGNNYKYRKTAFANSGHAFNLAEKLNKMFSTTAFTVHELIDGEAITENEVSDLD